MTRRTFLTAYLVTLLLLVAAPAHAYIDPGSTSIVFQAIIAGLAAAGTGIVMGWERLKSLFRRRNR